MTLDLRNKGADGKVRGSDVMQMAMIVAAFICVPLPFMIVLSRTMSLFDGGPSLHAFAAHHDTIHAASAPTGMALAMRSASHDKLKPTN